MSARVLVTGASGFLGGALVEALVERGIVVRTLQRTLGQGGSERLSRFEREGRVENVLASIEDPDAVLRAAEGVEAVFHVAAKAGAWGSYDGYFRANVLGTRHVLAACRAHAIRTLVHTSSPSIVHAGGDQEGIDESTPIATRHASHYSATKAIAEREVLAADGTRCADGTELSTVALRPHLVWGPGDTKIAPGLVERARRGRLVLVGGGEKKIDATFITSAVHAHVLAYEKLTAARAAGERAACAGRAYFIAQGEPKPTRELMLGIVRAYGLDPNLRSVPLRVAKVLGSAVELAWWLRGREDEPPLTRFLAEQLGTAHWYSLAAAERDLGYHAPITTAEGLERLAAWVKAGR
jgi:nucleoside-diphosphate-sugar epimerase